MYRSDEVKGYASSSSIYQMLPTQCLFFLFMSIGNSKSHSINLWKTERVLLEFKFLERIKGQQQSASGGEKLSVKRKGIRVKVSWSTNLLKGTKWARSSLHTDRW